MESEVSKINNTPMASVISAGQRHRGAVDTTGSRGTRSRLKLIVVLGALFIALVGSILFSASVGAVSIPMHHLVAALLNEHALNETEHTILFSIRLPRVLASAVVGGGLALSGLMFQGLFRNPLADPYIIGASGGAAVGACIGIVFLAQLSILGFSATAILAFVGAVVTMLLVYSLARTRGRTSGVTLLLAGFAVGTMLSNSTYLFELIDPNPSYGQKIVTAWLHGVIGIPEGRQLAVTGFLLAVAIVCAYPLMRRLNTLALGDEYAHQLGIRVEQTRIGIILVASLLTAIAVSLGGLISFAGLIVPHVVRLLMGPDHLRLLPVALLAGAIFLVLTDTLARTLFAPSELPVGILMVFTGGPFFLYLLRKSSREYIL